MNSIQEALKNLKKGNEIGMFCPFCDDDTEAKTNVSTVESEYDKNQYWDQTNCEICGNSWYEIYTLTSYEIYDDKTCKTHSINAAKPSSSTLMKNWVRRLMYWAKGNSRLKYWTKGNN